MKALAWLWNLLRQLVGLVLPLFARARDLPPLGYRLRWVLHFVLIALILAGLWWVNHSYDLPVRERGGRLGDFWLPGLFLVVYGLSWLGWWLWKLLWPGEEGTEFPDINAAWEEALAALRKARIELSETPLFLVLGRPATGEEGLFSGADLQLTVSQVPRRADAPLRVYANHEGIYLTCAGASLLGRQASLFTEEAGPSDPSPRKPGDWDTMGLEDKYRTLAAGDIKRMQSILKEVGDPKQIQTVFRKLDRKQELTEEENRLLQRLAGGQAAAAAPGRRGRLLKEAPRIATYTARFKHLCRLIVRDRRPYCPINGILALVPLAATASDESGNQVSLLCARELAAAREVMQLDCPVWALLCDLDTAPGCTAFLERLPEDERQRRLGRSFPLVPDAPPDEVPVYLEGVVRWICQGFFPTRIYRLFGVETARQPDVADAVRANTALYHFLGRMRGADRPLARIVGHGLALRPDGPPMLAGCYVASTGQDPAEQGFIPGVFRKLVESQEFVAWTEAGLAEEADYERWTRRGYIALALVGALVVAVVGYLIYASKS
jgi:hypothetical protein